MEIDHVEVIDIMDIVNQEVTQLQIADQVIVEANHKVIQIADQVIAEVNHKVTQIGAL